MTPHTTPDFLPTTSAQAAVSSPQTPAAVFEPAFIEALRELFEERIVFQHWLGFKITELAADQVVCSLEMKPELVGNFVQKRLHGGVISAGLDAVGGLAVMAAVSALHMDEAPLARLVHFAKLGTIDLRIDYLRPAIGQRFALHAHVLRLGSRVATTRMEFVGEGGVLLAAGAAAYMVS